MSINKCIFCEYAVIHKDYDRATNVVIACRQHQDIFAPVCEYQFINTEAEPTQANAPNALNALDCVDTISRNAAIKIASGYCHPANIAKEIAKLPFAESEDDKPIIQKALEAGKRGEEVRFRINGRLFAVRELAQ